MAPRRGNRRNLVKRGGVWYFERIVGGRRFRRSLGTSILEEAKARRDKLERELAMARFSPRVPPPFATLAREALASMQAQRDAEAETAYAATTARDRRAALREDGPIAPHLGHLRIDTIDATVLRRWHDLEVIGRGRSFKTGDNLLDTIEQVLRFARTHGDLDRRHKPVAELREELRAERRTKRSRAAASPARACCRPRKSVA